MFVVENLPSQARLLSSLLPWILMSLSAWHMPIISRGPYIVILSLFIRVFARLQRQAQVRQASDQGRDFVSWVEYPAVEERKGRRTLYL